MLNFDTLTFSDTKNDALYKKVLFIYDCTINWLIKENFDKDLIGYEILREHFNKDIDKTLGVGIILMHLNKLRQWLIKDTHNLKPTSKFNALENVNLAIKELKTNYQD